LTVDNMYKFDKGELYAVELYQSVCPYTQYTTRRYCVRTAKLINTKKLTVPIFRGVTPI